MVWGCEAKSVPWCMKYDRAIDYDLVKVDKPDCIRENNGCGNCKESGISYIRQYHS